MSRVRGNQPSPEEQVYSPHDVAVRLGISTATLRRHAQAYEHTFGELARDSRVGRVWPQEALDRLKRARTAVQNGRFVSVEGALKAIAAGEDVEAMPIRAGIPEDAAKKATVAVETLSPEEAAKTKAEILNEIMKTMTRQKLSLWQYVVGISLTVAAVGWDQFLSLTMIKTQNLQVFSALPLTSALPLGAIVPLIFGFWVGLTRRLERLHWPSVGAVALVLAIGALSITFAVNYIMVYVGRVDLAAHGIEAPFGFTLIRGLLPVLLFTSGAVLGNALLRRVFGVAAFQVEPDSADTSDAAGWTPRQQAILGFVGVLLSALIPAIATVVSAAMGNG